MELKAKMEFAKTNSVDVVHIDETTCSMKTFQQHAWAAVNKNVESKQMMIDEPKIAILLAASPNRGVIAYMIKTKAFNNNDFLEFLSNLRNNIIAQPFTVLLDNCSIHKTQMVISYANESRIDLVFNVPY